MSREKVCLSVPFWGLPYCEKMLRITLPALLAPGNLPALAAEFDVEISLVTESKLFEHVAQSRCYRQLQQHATVSLVPLDDLLTGTAGDYGPVLTFALFRGFTHLGPRMTDTWLMFLNADFILADGSYRTAARLMKEGHRVIHCPSFRAISEEAMPALEARIDPDTGILAVPPREMVDLAIRHKHVTVRARTVNQKLCHQWRMDQFYWYVDERTLIGYQWPIALVAIKPERVVTTPRLMFDYGVIPDLCPTAPKYYISDSDDYFMLEPQSRMSGNDLVRLGWIEPDEIAADLNKWTTAEHRECGVQMHVFHSGDLPANMEPVIAESHRYMADLVSRLGPPNPHDDHPLFRTWWAGVVERIQAPKAEIAAPPSPPVEDSGTAAPPLPVAIPRRLGLVQRAAGLIYRRLFGGLANIQPIHPLWIDLIDVVEAVKTTRATAGSVAWILPGNAALASVIAPGDTRIALTDMQSDLPDHLVLPEGRLFNLCVIDIPLSQIDSLQSVYERARAITRDGGRICLRVDNTPHVPVRVDDLEFCEKAMPDKDLSTIHFHGDRLTRRLQQLQGRVNGSLFARPGLRLVLIALSLVALAPFCLLANRRAHRAEGAYTSEWSSMVAVFQVKKG